MMIPKIYRKRMAAGLVPLCCLVAVVLQSSCVVEQPESASSEPQPEENAIHRAIAAHGGMDAWQSFGAVAFDIVRGESATTNTVDLRSRKARMASEQFEIGFDGTDVWIMPGLEAFPGSPSFYNGLDFYFFGMPFLLADPGTVHEDLGRVTVDGEPYDAVRVSFEDDVGASPGDYYVAHFDVESHQLRFLLYTVTFFSGEPNENYNVRVYDEWQEVQGLLVPMKATSFAWDAENMSFGEQRSEATYRNVSIEASPPDSMMFVMPAGAVVDTAGVR